MASVVSDILKFEKLFCIFYVIFQIFVGYLAAGDGNASITSDTALAEYINSRDGCDWVEKGLILCGIA